jgi:hypothetical protein
MNQVPVNSGSTPNETVNESAADAVDTGVVPHDANTIIAIIATIPKNLIQFFMLNSFLYVQCPSAFINNPYEPFL